MSDCWTPPSNTEAGSRLCSLPYKLEITHISVTGRIKKSKK